VLDEEEEVSDDVLLGNKRKKRKKKAAVQCVRGNARIELATSRTQSENHTTRPIAHLCYWSSKLDFIGIERSEPTLPSTFHKRKRKEKDLYFLN